MKAADGTTVIGASVKIHGDISGSEDLRIEGEVHGSVRIPGSKMTIGPSARVKADLAAQDVIISGRVDGDIWATGRTELRSGAIVLGDIFSPRLSIEEGAAARGRVDPSRAGELPTASGQKKLSLSTEGAQTISGTPRPAIVLTPVASSTSDNPVRSGLPAGLAAALARAADAPVTAADVTNDGNSDAPLFAETEVSSQTK